MRERARTEGLVRIRGSYTFKRRGSADTYQKYDAGSVPKVTETMSDDLPYNRGIGKCFHEKIIINHSPPSSSWSSTDGAYIDVYNPVAYAPPNANFPTASVPSEQILLRAIQNIKPKLKAKVSVPNFLFELKDLRRIIPDASTIQRNAAALTAIVTNPFKGSRRWAGSELHNTVASQHLNAQFGYLPLIDDAFKIVEAFKDFNQKVRDFKKNAGKSQVGYHKESWGSGQTFPEVTVYDVPNFVRFYYRDRIVDGSTVIGLNYSYSVDFPSLKAPGLFYKYIGFRSNPRILWDALPFSFVVDWLLGVGRFLETLDDGAVPVDMKIVSGWRTDKYTIVREYFAEARSHDGGGWDSSLGKFGEIRVERYARVPLQVNFEALMDIPPLPTFNSINRNKVMLAGSLGKVLTHKR